jgi:hypothetical protein
MHLTIARSADDDQHAPQSPRTKGVVQALVCEVKKHTEGLDNDVQMTNEMIGVLEATQLATDTKQVMQARFVPSYYARDLINKLQQLKQGAKI